MEGEEGKKDQKLNTTTRILRGIDKTDKYLGYKYFLVAM
jgi:hypothetical protein